MFEIVEAIHDRTPHVEPEIETTVIQCVNRCGESISVDVNDDGSAMEDRGWTRVGDQWACPYAEDED